MKTIQFFSLIEELCPNGVDFEEINKVFTIVRPPRKLTRDKYKETGKYAIVDQGQSLVIGYTDEEEALVPEQDYVVFGDHTRYVKYVDFPFVQGADGLVILRSKSKAYCLKYLFYAFSNLQIPSRGYNRHWTIANKLKIPIPPLPLQEEIVRILDTFTALENELEAELAARTKQYEYYIHKLLFLSQKSIEPNVQSIKLGDIMHYSKESILANQLDKTCYVGVDNLLQNKKGKVDSEYVPKNGRLIKYKKDDILIGNIRPYLKKIWIADNEGGTNGDVLCIRVNKDAKAIAIPAYLYYVLSSEEFFTYAIKNSKGAKMPRGDKALTMKFEFPLPSLEVQKQIVSILDRFDALVNNLKSGLPAEIALRRKQYEYYRDKLLAFHPLN